MNNYINLLCMILFSVICLLTAIENINPYKLSLKENIFMGSSMVITYLFLNYTFPNTATIAIYFIPVIFIYRKSKKMFQSILMEICVCLIMIITDSLITSISFFIFGENFKSTTKEYWTTCFLIFIILFIITKMVGKLLKNNKEFIIENLKSKYFIIIYIMLFITFAIFYIDINWIQYIDPTYTTKANAIICLIYGVMMILICMLLLFMVRKEEKFKYEQVAVENLKEYTRNLEQLYTEMRKFRHDYINILSSLAAFIEERDIDGLEKYFNKNIYPLNSQMNKNNYKLGLLKNIQLQEIKGLISAKVIRAQEFGINVIIEITEIIDKINMDKIDLTRCLGIILDNAIEASINSDKKVINIALIKKDNSVIIVVINTFKGKIMPISKMYKPGISTKGDNRGLGLSNLKEILDRYDNISLDTYIKNNEFIQEITISNKI